MGCFLVEEDLETGLLDTALDLVVGLGADDLAADFLAEDFVTGDFVAGDFAAVDIAICCAGFLDCWRNSS